MTNLFALIVLLMPYISEVESGHNDYAISKDGHESAGRYQICKVVVDDVNRIYKTQFTYADRFNSQKAEFMVKLYLVHYSRNRVFKTDLEALEVLSRKWNGGGPNGDKKSATEPYWEKIRSRLERDGKI